MSFKIYLSPPNMGGGEQKYIEEAFASNWIAPHGPSIQAFEDEMKEYIGVSSALALVSGTSALHLALRWLGAKEGDLVFCSDFTFIGSCGAICYERCIPVFIDSEPDSWNMSPVALEKAFLWAEKKGKLPKAVIVVDLYGESADWDALLPVCKKYGVPVIEDAAEAVGATYKGRRCGSFGDISMLSFNGNKIMTSSGGGMALSNNELAVEKMRFWSMQAREPAVHYEHKEYGYNYRMSNICACIGRGQLEFMPEKLKNRKKIHETYRRELKDLPAYIKQNARTGEPNYWLNLLVLDTKTMTPEAVVGKLQDAGIEARPAWKPMHMQPVFSNAMFFSHYGGQRPGVGESAFRRALCLPSGDGMSEEQQQTVTDALKAVLETGVRAVNV